MSFILLVGWVSPAFAVDLVIPEVNARISEEFALETTAKLDDFIEDVARAQQSKQNEGYSFAASIVVQAGVGMAALYHLRKNSEEGIVALAEGVQKAGSLGRASVMPARLADMARRWGLLATAGHTAASIAKEKQFTVHADDLGIFLNILRSFRSRQATLLAQLRQANGGTAAHLEQEILEHRPSFKKIYEGCSADREGYKTSIYIDVYSRGMWDYFKLLTTDPDAINAQLSAGLLSPTLNSYLSQDVLPRALKKCFNVSSEDVGSFSTDAGQRFVAGLVSVDALAKFVVVAAVISIVRLEELKIAFSKMTPAGKMKTLNSLQLGWVAKITKPIRDLFAKISPVLIKKAMIATQAASSAFNMASLTREYYKAKNEVGSRRTAEEFNQLANGYFRDRAAAQIQELANALSEPGLDPKDKEPLEKELRNWQQIYAQFPTDKQRLLSGY